MKIKLIAAATVGLFAVTVANADTAGAVQAVTQPVAKQQMVSASSDSALSSQEDQLSYTIGVDLGTNFKKQSIDVKPDVLVQGIKDVLADKPLALTKEQMNTVLKNFQQQMMTKQAAKMKSMAEQNLQEGDAFLAKNKSLPGVVTLPSGLQYKIVKAGTGEKPTATDSVTVDYTGTLINGTVFDSSAKTGKPVTFKVNQVIPGWTEALQLMPAGSTWQVFIPAKLAYGERGVGGPIGPNETLIFEVHLISVAKADVTAETPKS